MSYEIIWTPKSVENLKELNKEICKRVIRKVEELKLSPYHFVEKLVDVNCWKLRIGDYRILLDIEESKKQINILKIGHRKNVYKK